MDEFLGEAGALVTRVDSVLSAVKDNVTSMRALLASWQRDLLFERKEGRVVGAEELASSMGELVVTRHDAVAKGGREIWRLLAASAAALGVEPGPGAPPAWAAYVDYMAGVVVEGLVAASAASANALHSQLDAEVLANSDGAPMVEVGLELVGPDVAWRPDVGKGGSGGLQGLRALVESWLDAYVGLGALVPRLDGGNGEDAEGRGWGKGSIWLPVLLISILFLAFPPQLPFSLQFSQLLFLYRRLHR